MNARAKRQTLDGEAAVNAKGRAVNLTLAWQAAILGRRKKGAPAPPYALPDPITTLVLMALSSHLDQYGRAFPSRELLAEETRLSVRTVGEHLRIAEAAGWIQVRERIRTGQAWRFHEYEALIPGQGTAAASSPLTPEGEAAGSSASLLERTGTPDRYTCHASVTRHEGVAAGAEGVAADDIKVRQEVPTNSPSELPISNSPSKNPPSPQRGNSATPSCVTDGGEKQSPRPRPNPTPTPATENDRRLDRLCRVIQDMPEADDPTVKICVHGSTLGEVRIARRMIAKAAS